MKYFNLDLKVGNHQASGKPDTFGTGGMLSWLWFRAKVALLSFNSPSKAHVKYYRPPDAEHVEANNASQS